MAFELKKRIRVLQGQHARMGEKIVEWVRDPGKRPASPRELARQLDGIAEVDLDTIDTVEFIDTPMNKAIFRLPPQEMVAASLARAEDPEFTIASYTLPDYYGIDTGSSSLDPGELFLSRVGDYTTGECE